MPCMLLPHLESTKACVLYRFVFKRYLDDDVFSSSDLDHIYTQIVHAVSRFHKMKGANRSRKTVISEQLFDLEIISNPRATPLYHFLYDQYPSGSDLCDEDLVSIFRGLVEVAKRLDAVRTSRGLSYVVPSSQKGSHSVSSCNEKRASDSTVAHEQCATSEEEQKSLHPSSFTNGYPPNSECDVEKLKQDPSCDPSARKITDANEVELESPCPNVESPALVHEENGNVPSESRTHVESEQSLLSNKGSAQDHFDVKHYNSESSVKVEKELYARARKSSSLLQASAKSSPFSVIGNQVQRDTIARSPEVVTCEDEQLDNLHDNCESTRLTGDCSRARLITYIKPYDGIRICLTGSPSKKCDGKRLNRPLGVTFDEVLQQWIVADTENNRVVTAPGANVLTSPRMVAPCAVVVVEPGVSFAVLTKYDIRIMYHDKRDAVLVINHSGVARGLAVTAKGNLLTLERIRGYWNVNVYECKRGATLVSSVGYPKMDNGLPSFLDLHRGVLIITDLDLPGLGTQSIMRFSMDEVTEKMKFLECIALGTGPTNRGHVEIKYISGVFIDDDGNILVADAKGRSLQVFTSKGIFLHNIKVVNGGLPYISGIWVNRDGFIGACARAETNGGLYVYRMLSPSQGNSTNNSQW